MSTGSSFNQITSPGKKSGIAQTMANAQYTAAGWKDFAPGCTPWRAPFTVFVGDAGFGSAVDRLGGEPGCGTSLAFPRAVGSEKLYVCS
jgi:hypothetical protein